jgi:hypothetical protein
VKAHESCNKNLKMIETDLKLIQALVEDPRAKADEVASSIGLGSKTHFFSTTIFGISSFSTSPVSSFTAVW